MNISPINFTGTLYFQNQKMGINTDHIVKFQPGSSGRTQVWLSNGDATQVNAEIEEFKSAYIKATKGKDEFVEIKTKAKPVRSI